MPSSRSGRLVSVIMLLVCGIAVLSATPARAGTIVLDAKGVQDVNNLKAIVLALINYESVFARLPAAFSVSNTNTPLLSWRVAILPYLGESALYNQFDLTKPWDDPANLPLISQMPSVFRSPGQAPGSTNTGYAAGFASGTMFEGSTGVKSSMAFDGTSNTILVGETLNSGIPWTAPNDIVIGSCPTLGGSGFSSFVSGAVPFVFADGHVGFLPTNIDCATLRGLFLRSDGLADTSAVQDYVAAAPVPEPATLLSLATGLAACGIRRRRGRHSPRAVR